MPYITSNQNTHSAEIYYEDHGSGQPVILIHGWPLSHRSWEGQVPVLVEAGFRCITYDRRGFGDSSAPWNGYDFSTLAGDLHALISQLKLQDCILCGFSMGAGEITRYLTNYGTENISKVVLISSTVPVVKQSQDNPHGIPEQVIGRIKGALTDERLAFLEQFHAQFYNYHDNLGKVTEQQLRFDWLISVQAFPRAVIKTGEEWSGADFTSEMANISVPTLIIHGEADQVVPIETSGNKAAGVIPNNQYIVISGGPHGLHVTHKQEVNNHLLNFLKS